MVDLEQIDLRHDHVRRPDVIAEPVIPRRFDDSHGNLVGVCCGKRVKPQQSVQQRIVIPDVVITYHPIAGMLAHSANEIEQLPGLVHPVGYLEDPLRAAGRVDDYRAEDVRV